MTPLREPRRRLANLGLLLCSTLGTVVLGEVAVRLVDGYALRHLELRHATVSEREELEVALAYVAEMPVPPSVDRAWFTESPPPLPRTKPDAELTALFESQPRGMLAVDVTKVWNAEFVDAEARKTNPPGGWFAAFPPAFYVFDPPAPTPYPHYRFPPNMTMPSGLVTNRFGFRGPQITLDKPSRAIRIAFVGASTTIDPHSHPFSYPELVGHWLQIWARVERRNVIVEIINAGREGFDSPDIAAVVRQELLPLEPDLVVYYEGANQFGFRHLLDLPKDQRSARGPSLPQGDAGLLERLQSCSALARRTAVLIGRLAPGAGGEKPKPRYRLRWPEGLDELDPDLSRPDLPPQMGRVLQDLESMRRDLRRIGSQLAVASFIWMVYEGMELDPVRDVALHTYLNEYFWPLRYRDMRRMADFQNRVFEKYAATHELPFLDVAGAFPRDPRLFSDAVHTRMSGTRLRAWVTFLRLLPVISSRLQSGALPRADREPLDHHPNLSPRRLIDWRGLLARAQALGGQASATGGAGGSS
jgi:hypothetical protein